MTRKQDDPIFKNVFGADWAKLPPALQKHYDVRPFSDDTVTIEGALNLRCRGYVKWFSWLIRLFKNIPPYTEDNVQTTVVFKGSPHSDVFLFKRLFNFKGRQAARFHSQLRHIGSHSVIEEMAFGLGWRCQFHWTGEYIDITHDGYVLCLFGKHIPVPITWLVGKGHGRETAHNDHQFHAAVSLKHPLWGTVYEYSGVFTFVERTDS